MAYEQAQAGWIEGGINHVVLCTDGDFTGHQLQRGTCGIIEEKRESNVPTALVLGYGTTTT